MVAPDTESATPWPALDQRKGFSYRTLAGEDSTRLSRAYTGVGRAKYPSPCVMDQMSML
jgi:hypothetical protein